MKKNAFYFSLFFFLFFTSGKAQLFSIGTKYEKKMMFHTSLNIPFKLEDKKHLFLVGIEYTSKNEVAPSGLQPQFTAMYHLIGDDRKNYQFSAAISSGYLFDFNPDFRNQFRFSPHLYFEYFGFFNLRVGYDYLLPFNRGYPFVSVGLGGLIMLKHIKFM